MENNIRQLPTLGFVEGVRLAFSRLNDFKGRSRRSEMWWWMMLVLIANFCSGFFTGGNMVANAAASTLTMLFGVSVTARRLHDVNQSAIWLYLSYVMGIVVQFFPVLFMSDFMSEYMEMLEYGQPTMQDMQNLMEGNMGMMAFYGLLSLVWIVLVIVVFIFTLLDSKPMANKWGSSPKYVS